MNMGGIGKGSQPPKDSVTPLTDIAKKAATSAKAGKIKSIKVKLKFDTKKVTNAAP